MWDYIVSHVLISLVAGALGGLVAILALSALRDKSETTEVEQRLLASWREANELSRQANEMRREQLVLDQDRLETLNELSEAIQSRTL